MTPWQREFYTSMTKPLTATSLRRIFLLLTRFHFTNANNFGELRELLKNMVWTEEESTPIAIELLGVFDPAKVLQKPAVYVGFRGFKFGKVAVNDYAGQSDDMATTYFSKPTDAELIVKAVTASEDMTAALADTMTAFLLGMRPLMVDRLYPHLRAMDIIGLTDVSMVEKSPDRRFECDLVTRLNFDYLLNVNLESHPIKKVALEWTPE